MKVVTPRFWSSHDLRIASVSSAGVVATTPSNPQARGDLRVTQIRIEFRADEIVVVPEDRIALLGAPLIVAEHHHRHAGPAGAADRAHFVHRDAERAVAGEADAGRVRVADLRSDDGGKAVAARAEQPRRKIFAPLLERRIGVADRAIVADVARDDRARAAVRPEWRATPGAATCGRRRAGARLRSSACRGRRLRGRGSTASAASAT